MTRQGFHFICLMLLVTGAVSMTACSRQTAEEKGKAIATEKIDMVKGIGGALEEKGSGAAEAVASGVGNVVKGLGKGFE